MNKEIIIYYTPQHILDMITMAPALGTGGFLTDIYAELNQEGADRGGERKGETPGYHVSCYCDPQGRQKVMLLLDARSKAWRGVCGHCGRERWVDADEAAKGETA